MTKYIKTPAKLKNPGWTKRNIKISKHIEDGSKVLDLGCGAKDLTKYIKPSLYVGIDYQSSVADIMCDFNLPFSLPHHDWDYIVMSGLLEYLSDLDMFFKHIKNNGSTYIITIWDKFRTLGNPSKLGSINEYVHIIEQHFTIVERDYWKLNQIFICKDKT